MVAMGALPSVTQVIGVYADFSRVPADVLDAACARGTEVHRLCAAIAAGAWVPGAPEDLAGYVQSFRRWFDFVEQVHVLEERFTDHRFGFTGQPDLIVTMRGDSAPSLVDLKTPATSQRAWRVQLAAYRHLARLAGFPVERTFSLRLKRDGGPAIVDEYRNSATDFAAFSAALTAYRYIKLAA